MAKKKKAGSYNPFYIPSLDQLKSDARASAQSQVDAAVGALPKAGDISGQFNRTGREFAAMDQGYTGFLKGQQVAAPAMSDTGLSTFDTPATGYQSPDAIRTAAAGSNALKMQGFGFANARNSAIIGSAATANENQQRNRRQLNDALINLSNQTAAEKAKYGALYQDALHQAKSDAFNAYQAYLGSQFNNAQLAASTSNQQGQLGIDQQNADIRQQNANTAADKAANAAANPKASAADKDRASGRNKSEAAMTKAMDESFTGPPIKTQYVPYSITIQKVGTNGQTQFVNLPAIQALATTPLAAVKAQAVATYHLDADAASTMSATPGQPYYKTDPGKVTKRSYQFVFNRGVAIMVAHHWSRKTARRLVRQFLSDQGFNPPPPPPPTTDNNHRGGTAGG